MIKNGIVASSRLATQSFMPILTNNHEPFLFHFQKHVSTKDVKLLSYLLQKNKETNRKKNNKN